MKYFILSLFLTLLPIFTFADVDISYYYSDNGAGTFAGIVCKIKDLVLYTVPFLVALAVILFLVGLTKYVGNGDNEEKRTEGTKLMVYGLLGLFVIVAVWSLVAIVTGTFGFSVGIPQFKGEGGSGC